MNQPRPDFSHRVAVDWLTEGGWAGATLRGKNWAGSALGPRDRWSQQLKTMVSLVMNAGNPMALLWGRDFTLIYNDAFALSFCGPDPLMALGQAAASACPPVWDEIAIAAGNVFKTGKSCHVESRGLLLIRDRSPERAYWDFHLNPVADKAGQAAGILLLCSETTTERTGERRRRCIARLAEIAREWGADALPPYDAFIRVLRSNPEDIPFALLYTVEPRGEAWLAGTIGLIAGSADCPIRIHLNESGDAVTPWPLAELARTGHSRCVECSPDSSGPESNQHGAPRPTAAYLAAVTPPGGTLPKALLVLGIHPHQAFDAAYREFFEAVAHYLGHRLYKPTDSVRPESPAAGIRTEAKILIAAADFQLAGPLSRMLAGTYTVTVVQDGFEALRRTRANPPDLVLCAADLPGLEGPAFLANLRSQASTRHIPVVVLSTRNDPAARAAAILGGASEWLARPLRPRAVLSSVQRLLNPKSDDHAIVEPPYRILLNQLPVVVWLADRQGRWTFVGDGWNRFTGHECESALGLGWVESTHPDDRAAVLEAFASGAAGRQGFASEFRLKSSSGEYGWVACNANPQWSEAGELAGFVGILTNIADRKRVEAALRESEERFEVTLHAANLSAWQWNIVTGEVHFNRRWAEMLGHTPDEIETHLDGWKTRVHPDDLQGMTESLHAHLQGQTLAYQSEYRLRTKSGGWLRVLDSGQIYARDPAGRALLAAGVHSDVSAHRVVDEALREREWELQMVMDVSPALMSYVDTDFRYRRANKRYGEWLGIDHETIRGKHPREVLGKAAWKLVKRELKQARDGATVTYQKLIPYRDGQYRWVEATYLPDLDPSGQVRGIVVHVLDISRRKQAELALAASERRYRNLVEALPIAVYTCDGKGRLTLYNDAAARLWGHRPEIGRPLIETTLSPELALGLQSPGPQDSMLPAGTPAVRTTGEMTVDRPDGTRAIVLPHSQPLPDGAGNESGMLHALVDITPIRDAERALRRHVNRQNALLQVTRTALRTDIADADFSATIFAVTDELCDADFCLNYRLDPLTGRLQLTASLGLPDKIRDLFNEISPPHLVGPVKAWIYPEPADEIPLPGMERDDLAARLGLKSFASLPVSAADGNLLGYFFFGSRKRAGFSPEDIRFFQTLCHFAALTLERREAERALRAADQRKDEFLAMLAHELRNPLAPIRNAVEILWRLDLHDATLARLRPLIDRQVSHLSRLIDDLLDVSRITRGKVILRREPVELRDVVDRAVEWSQALIDAQEHDLLIHLPADSMMVDGDPTRLAQIFANLLNNAAKYTEPRGTIELSAFAGSGEITISVKDNGQGIAPKLLPHVFELFTQAERALDRSQGGLGIGLTLVKNLVELHGGSIEGRSAGIGQGSEFIVRLPLASASALAHSPENSPPEPDRDTR